MYVAREADPGSVDYTLMLKTAIILSRLNIKKLKFNKLCPKMAEANLNDKVV